MANEQWGGYDLTPEQQAKFQQLNAEFSSLWWDPAGGYGFDPRALTDGNIRNIYNEYAGRDPEKSTQRQAALNNIYSFFDEVSSGAGQAISPEKLNAIFDPLTGKIDESAAAAQANAAGQINRSARGASDRATEALAGTGLSRSGVAANTFQGIEERRQGLEADAYGDIEQKRAEQHFKVAAQRANFELNDVLHERDWDEGSIRMAQEFQYQLLAMQFEFDLEQAGESWTDLIAPIAQIAGTAAMAFL